MSRYRLPGAKAGLKCDCGKSSEANGDRPPPKSQLCPSRSHLSNLGSYCSRRSKRSRGLVETVETSPANSAAVSGIHNARNFPTVRRRSPREKTFADLRVQPAHRENEMRERNDLLCEKIRRKRRDAGHTQESLGYKLGVSGNSVGKWERGEVTPSATNIRALTKLGLLDGSESWDGNRKTGGQEALSPELIERVMQTFRCHPSRLHLNSAQLRDERVCVLVAFFEALPIVCEDAFLEIISLTNGTMAVGSARRLC